MIQLEIELEKTKKKLEHIKACIQAMQDSQSPKEFVERQKILYSLAKEVT